mmetsp:Transcript_21269/g.32460  ORF Transcript_21269/g.32460 Transcript_21269/m.32460 type:complete len:817 (+) Transcript_21269:1174-3624(+)
MSGICACVNLPGGNIQKEGSDEATNKKPNVIIDDYLYQRHVYRKQAAARLLRPAAAGGGAAKLNEETHTKNNADNIGGEISLNLLASPLEVALISCCVRPPTDDNNNSNKEQQSSSSATQRSRLHRPILPSNADEESDATSSMAQQQPLDTPRTISMKDPADIHTSNNANNSSSNEVGTLQKGQEAHFLKLLQMYCPNCKEGLMYRSLVLEILQRTADWENGVLHLSTSGGSGDNGGSRLIGGVNVADDVNVTSSCKKVGIGQVGYTFRKQFHSGWYIGKVTAIIPRGSNYTTTTAAASAATATTVKDRRCVYNDGDEEDLSLEELKHLAELEELDRYHPDNDNNDGDDDDEYKMKKKEGVNGGVVTNSPDGSGDVTKSEEGGRTESSTEAPEVVATAPSPPTPPTVNRAKSNHTVMNTFLAVGGMKLLARWLVEAYTVVQPPPSNQPNKRKSSFTLKTEAAAVVSPSSTGALLLPLLTLLKSIPFDKDIIVASSIHKHIKRYKKALDKLSKGMDAQSLNEVVHPIAGGGSVGKAMRGVEEVMTSWNNATAALSAAAAAANTTTTSQQDDDDDESNSHEKQKQLDPYKELRDQLQSRFDELAAFHNNRTNPPEWVPKHVLGVVMASPKAAPASPTASSKPTLNNNTSSSSMKSNHAPTKTNNNEWGTNRASAAQLARERFLEGFRKQKDAVSSTTTPANKWTGSPPEKMQKVAHGNDRSSSSSSKRVCWVDKPVGRKGVSPQPLVTERVFEKEEEYVEEDEEVNVHMMFGGDDGNDDNVPMQEDGAGTYQGDGDAVIEREGIKDDDQEDSDLDDMF